jgi:hypothetical protein
VGFGICIHCCKGLIGAGGSADERFKAPILQARAPMVFMSGGPVVAATLLLRPMLIVVFAPTPEHRFEVTSFNFFLI